MMIRLFKYSFIALVLLLILFSYKYRRHLPIIGKHFGTTVGAVITNIEPAVLSRLAQDQIFINDFEGNKLFILISKDERTVQLYTANPKPKLIKSYPMTAFSGELGPKNYEGDRQIPEGIYKIEGFNPNSLYHLSLKLNYPNAIDRKRSTVNSVSAPGSNIFIHGKRVTVGCIPVGDEAIEEIFYIAHKVKSRNITVLITPSVNLDSFNISKYAINKEDLKLLTEKYSELATQLKILKQM